MNQKFYSYLLFGAALLAAVYFFIAYPQQDPRSIIQNPSEPESVSAQATELLSQLGFSVANYTAKAKLHSNERLLDSLQKKVGRQELNRKFSENSYPNIKPFYWEIIFYRSAVESEEKAESGGEGPGYDNNLRVRMDLQNSFIELINDAEVINDEIVNRQAVASVFYPDSISIDSLKPVFETLSDSLLSRLLYFDLQQRSRNNDLEPERKVQQATGNLEQGHPYQYTAEDAVKLGRYYLEQTGWDATVLISDTVYIERINSINAANIRFSLAEEQLHQNLNVEVKVAPTGGLLSITTDYNPDSESASGWNNPWDILRNVLVFLFILGAIIIFAFRIRARAVDTQASLVLGVLAGLVVSVLIMLSMLPYLDFYTGVSRGIDSLQLIISVGMGGAAASLGFFILFAISDSITRQYWPEKLYTYDFLRQGMFFNKPIGLATLRSIGLAFILAGSWTLVNGYIPNLHVEIDRVFLNDEAAWPPLHMFLQNGWYSFSLVLGIFLVIGGQFYAQTRNKFATGFILILACGIMVPLVNEYGPPLQQFVLSVIIGLLLTGIYFIWDFVTLLLSYFLFLGLLSSSTGWIIEGSPDNYIFIIYVILLVFLAITGMIASLKGKDEKVLPNFVPDYVEELAQEERIKQELQIARNVQQSFLPVRTPDIDRLDLAAICKPAYETGGDYYDFIQIDKHRIAVAVGDVSGKGIQAAFYMTFVKGILHSLCREIDSPAELLKKANRLFCDNAPRGTFISLVYGIIDLEKKTFHFARAGHNPVVKVNAASGDIEELQPEGIGIGLTGSEIFDTNIDEVLLKLQKDDVLILYTDGIVEALNTNHVFYGNKRLISMIRRNSHKSSVELLNALSEDLVSFTNEAKQHDDMTMMIIKMST